MRRAAARTPPLVDLSPAQVVLCWDIDGTLLTTDRAGIGAWEDALLAVCGLRRSLSGYRTAGLTDVEIAGTLLEAEGLVADGPTVARLLARYEERLPDRLGDRRGGVLPGVLEFLEWNRLSGSLRCMLLTGNTARGAWAKLARYDLSGFFERGAFARLEAGDRVSVARQALAIARDWVGPAFAPRGMLVIGDTPHDVACGTAVGARTLAVASGGYPLDALVRAGPWRAVARLPDPGALAAMALENAA